MPFVTVAAGQCQVVCLIRATRRLGEHMVEGEAHRLSHCGDTAMTASPGACAACKAIEPTQRRIQAQMTAYSRYSSGESVPAYRLSSSVSKRSRRWLLARSTSVAS